MEDLAVRNEEDVSPECLAWADSCIISSPDDSDQNNWGTFRDALTEIIDINPEMFVASSTNIDEEMTENESIDLRMFGPDVTNSSNEEVSEIISMLRFESDPSRNSLHDRYFPESVAEPLDNASVEEDGEEEEEEAELLPFQVFKDDFVNAFVQDNVEDLNVVEDPVKVTPQEIFKVWDLEIARDEDDEEEEGLVLQLKKALVESSLVQPLAETLNDDQAVAEKSSIDDLIAGISDLSLVETFK